VSASRVPVEWLEDQLSENVLNIMARANAGELSREYRKQRGEDGPPDDVLAAAAIVEMCRQAFTGEWDDEVLGQADGVQA